MTTPTVQPVYGAPGSITNAIASLGTSATLVAGWESATVDNTSTLYDDVLVSGQVTVGTSPTAGTVINVYCVAPLNPATPTWPDVFDGTTGAKTITSLGVGAGFLRLVTSLSVDTTTSSRAYAFSPVSIASLYGGVMPQKFALFTTHNTGVNLNATAGDHFVVTQGINYATPSI